MLNTLSLQTTFENHLFYLQTTQLILNTIKAHKDKRERGHVLRGQHGRDRWGETAALYGNSFPQGADTQLMGSGWCGSHPLFWE